ncbi:MAG TPA: hypothetical protein P5571_00455 [Candidatus Krumholzibacteria bacterium]|nr:hypothetical protein [Candidatus Krumholzibacteria bacterium]HRX49826.1 hypothetical protein [Candidatus Krumholzibacteria bacterium]
MGAAKLVNRFFDLLWAPFGGHGWLALAVVSALTGILLLWLFKLVTPQARLAAARRRLLGHLYEMGLYQDDLPTLMRVQGALALANLRYVTLTLPALLVLLPPAALVLVHLEARYQHPALVPGETVLVRAHVDPGRPGLVDALRLDPGAGLALDAPPVRDAAGSAVWWRLRVESPGRHEVTLSDGASGRWTKAVKADAGVRPASLRRERGGAWRALIDPAEPPLPADGPLAAVELRTAPEPDWFAQRWFWGFCVFSVAGGLAVKRWLKVEL